MGLTARSLCLGFLALTILSRGAMASSPDLVEIRVVVEERAQLERLAEIVEITNFRRGEAHAIVSSRQIELLREAEFQWRTVVKRKVAVEEMCPDGWEHDSERSWSCYPTYSQYEGLMQGFAADFPDLCRLERLGPASNHVRPHSLWALRISDNPQIQEPEPEVLLTSTMHGDETSGYALMLRLIHHLLTGYGNDPQITELVDSLEIWINPNANPDGTYYTSDDTVDGAIRYYVDAQGASSGIDGNRNFPDPRAGAHPDGNPWWAETEAMMAFAGAHTTTLSVNFHGGAEVVNYPWDTWSRRHVDDEYLINLSRGYADLAQADSPAGYMTDQSNGITNGWDWYSITGGRQDFMTYWHSDREVLIEISEVKTPPAAELDDLWSWNRRALLGYIGRARDGIHGLVTGPVGEPLPATIELVGHDSVEDNSFVSTDPEVGDYHRLVLPGTYTVQISAAGYHPQVIDDLAVVEDAPTTLDVVLQPILATVVGRITTPATLTPISGATVQLVGTEHSAATGEDGRFTLSGVPVGDYTVRFTAEQFETAEEPVAVAENTVEKEFSLVPLTFRRMTILKPE